MALKPAKANRQVNLIMAPMLLYTVMLADLVELPLDTEKCSRT
jgi:hypothetical protein